MSPKEFADIAMLAESLLLKLLDQAEALENIDPDAARLIQLCREAHESTGRLARHLNRQLKPKGGT